MQHTKHLQHKLIIVGVSGGISAYKTPDLVRRLAKAGATVRVVLTESAKRFVTPLTMTTVSGHKAIEDVWELSKDGDVGHVHIGNDASLIVIAPATAHTIARLAAGFGDDALCTLVLSSHCPVLLAPAMETEMWEQKTTQRNVAFLRETGRFFFIGPDAGALASGKEGLGRMTEPDEIYHTAASMLSPHPLAGKTVVVTAGPTREALDPIRYLSNRSSGKMGYAIAELAARQGARTHLVHGPVSLKTPHGVLPHPVQSANEMLETMRDIVPKADVLIMAAAVADYAPKKRAQKKLKKKDLGASPRIDLAENPDIVATLAKKKGKTLFIGFAAETNDVEQNALGKLAKKGLDLIVANDVSEPGVGMDEDENRVSIYDARGLVLSTEKRPKTEIAEMILAEARARLKRAK
jgi:phosphopantothenoylcysteine decarboxylase / phosphopantothenate---cysteine ligase